MSARKPYEPPALRAILPSEPRARALASELAAEGVFPFKFSCPFCGREVAIVDDAKAHLQPMGRAPATLPEKPAITHRLPTCRMFDRLDPVDFLERCRRELIAGAPS